jgi:subtilisin family serine protease
LVEFKPNARRALLFAAFMNSYDGIEVLHDWTNLEDLRQGIFESLKGEITPLVALKLPNATNVELPSFFRALLDRWADDNEDEILRVEPVLYFNGTASTEDGVEVQKTNLAAGNLWNLDRINQRNLPLTNTYHYDYTGKGTHIYIFDSGINTEHEDFGGRAVSDYSFYKDGNEDIDCNGHGTHVAGTAAGATYGVAKEATVHSIRVLDCNGMGSTLSIIAGLNWLLRINITTLDAPVETPAVLSMSLGGGESPVLDNRAERVSKFIGFVAAAGNENQDTCFTSPAQVKEVITVGSTGINQFSEQAYDTRSSFSNKGPCVDIFAPGNNIVSCSNTNNKGTSVKSGTSMAAPLVAGVCALYLESLLGSDNVSWINATGLAVMEFITSQGTKDVLTLNDDGRPSPNLLLYSPFPGEEYESNALGPFAILIIAVLATSAVCCVGIVAKQHFFPPPPHQQPSHENGVSSGEMEMTSSGAATGH